jgi:beta-lactam-binding protein with PASTA domain
MRLRRHAEPGVLSTVKGRRVVRDVALLLGVFIIGYGVAYLWLAPKQVFAGDHSTPRVLELPLADAQQRLAQLKLRPRVVDEHPHGTIPRGSVVWQDPPAGTIVPEGTTVQLTLSTVPAMTPVPDVAGLAASQATKVLEAAGFTVAAVDSVATSPAAPTPGVVVATRPAAGATREPGAVIGLVVTR